jgi:hypothetical protein
VECSRLFVGFSSTVLHYGHVLIEREGWDYFEEGGEGGHWSVTVAIKSGL